MDAITAFLTRRSVREGFTDKPIPLPIIEKILQCGLSAPSSKNAKPWRFHIVTDSGALDEIADLVVTSDDIDSYVPHDPTTGEPWPHYVSTVIESAEVLRRCSTAIFVENRGVFSRGRSELVTVPVEHLMGSLAGYGFEMIGVGAAVQSLFVAAHSLGVAGAFMGDVVIAEAKIKQRLRLEGDLAGVIALGYSGARIPERPAPAANDPANVVWHNVGGPSP